MNRTNTIFTATKAILVLIFLFMIMACQQPDKRSDKPVISVSILPQKYFVEKIAGDKFEVNVMVPPGASHENYDPTPAQIISLANAFVYFRIGNIEFENTWIQKFSENYPKLQFINLSEKLDLIESSDGHQHGQPEPHTWMSPLNVKKMAETIYETLAKRDKENESFYALNYQQFLKELDSLSAMITMKFQNSKSNSFIIYHPALTYYAKDFGLTQWAIEMEGKSPSVQHIKNLIDIAKRGNIKVILVQKQFDSSKAETIANEIGGIVIGIDPLNEHWFEEIESITNKLSEALSNEYK